MTVSLVSGCASARLLRCLTSSSSVHHEMRALSTSLQRPKGFKPLKDFHDHSIQPPKKFMPHDPPKFPPNWNYPKPDIPNNYEPAKLLVVWRDSRMYGTFTQEKIIMHHLKLTKFDKFPVIVKNTTSMNRLLWKVKGLVRIRPLTFPDGLPEEGDGTGTYLNYNGEMRVAKRLRVEPQQIGPNTEYEQKKLSTEYLKEYYRLKWNESWDWDLTHIRTRKE